MGEEVLVTEVQSGRVVGKIRGVSALASFNVLTAGYNAYHISHSQLPYLPTNPDHLPPFNHDSLLSSPRLSTPCREHNDASASLHSTDPKSSHCSYPRFTSVAG